MAVIDYKCTVCKREIEIPENRQGLEIIQRCIITEGCRGELYRIGRKQDFKRGDFPSRVPGLTDYTPRRAVFDYSQAVQSTDWFITHNMGVVPSIQVLINSAVVSAVSTETIPCAVRGDSESFVQVETTDFTIEIINANELILHFPNPVSGIAQLVARSTSHAVVETEDVATAENIQLTTTGSLLTIATLNEIIPEPNNITLDITYVSPDSATTIVQTYNVSTVSATGSPWDDFQTIIIQGKRYKVRTFDTLIPEMTNGNLPTGSSFFFSAIDIQAAGSPPSRSINPREVYILLGHSPYENVDKVKDQFIEFSSVTTANAELSFFLSNRELFAFDTIISSTFPPIREVS